MNITIGAVARFFALLRNNFVLYRRYHRFERKNHQKKGAHLMFCTQCGTKLPDDARFCTNCGASVASKAPAPAKTQAAEPAPAQAPDVDPGETVVTLDAVEPTSEKASAVEAAAETVTDPGETVVTLDAVNADPGETVVTLDAVDPSANAEAEAAAVADPGETVVTLDAVNPEAPAETTEPQADQVDPSETVVTLDAAEPSDEQTAEPQPAADPEPTAEPIIDDASPVDAAEAEEIFETDDNAAVAVAFPGDDAAEPAAVADDPTTLVNVNDDPTTIAEFDEDAQATAEAMESLGVAHPTAGATVVDLPQQQMTDTTMQAAPIPQPQPQPQMPMPQQPQQKKRRWPVFAGLGLVAAGAAVAAILLLTPNANAVEITSGSQDAVVCTVDTKVLPKKKDRVIHSYTATLTPKNGGKSYKIKVKGDDGFTIGDFGKVKPGDYSCKIEDTKGNTVQNFNTTVVKKDDTSAEKPAESVTVNTPKKDDDASTSTDNGSSSDTTSKDDASSDDASKDDSTTEDDSSTSSDSTSSSKPSKSDKKTDTSKDTTNTTAPATIDDATYKAACTAYKSKLNSLIKKYGEPELVSTGTSDYQISGVQFAQLVDFNGDGLEELVTVHSKTKAKSFNKKTRLSNGDYVLDVWGYNGKKVVNLYSGSPEASNGGYVFVTFKTMIGDSSDHVYLTQLMSDDTAVLVDDEAEYKYFTYDGTEFKAAEGELHGDDFNYQSAFLIKGYSDNLEDQDTSAPEGAIDTSKLNLNNTVDTVEQTLMALTTKISGTDTDADANSSKSSDSSSSKSDSSKKSSKSSSSSSSSKSYSYDDSDDSYGSDYDDSYDDSSDYDDSYDDSTDSVPPTEFTDVDE